MAAPNRTAPAGASVPPASPRTTTAGSNAGQHFSRRLWWLTFGLFAAAMALWALAMPPFSSPDETAHVVKAAAVARGQLLGHDVHTPAGDTITYVSVPKAQVGPVPCFAHHGTVSAACQAPQPTSTELVPAGTLAGHYQPLYYAIVGLGSLAFPGPAGLYVMRLLSALLNAFFLASALQSARAWRSGLGTLGFAVAVTPMTYFMGAGVNPSGLEITSALCVWTSLLALLGVPGQVDRRLVARLALAASALALSRSLSPLWLLVIGVVVVVATGVPASRQVLRRVDVRIGLTVVLVATLAAAAWILGAGALTLRPSRTRQPLPLLEILAGLQARFWPRSRQMVGQFGWLDTTLPGWIYTMWMVLLILLLLACLGTAGIPRIAAVALLLVAVVVLPAAIEASQHHVLGFVWQGRYTMPLAVGLPLLLGYGVDQGRARFPRTAKTAATAVLLALILAAQVVAYWVNLRRYTVGAGHGLGVSGVAWAPPVPAALLLVAFVAVEVALAGALVVSARLGPPRLAARLLPGGEPWPMPG